jgi:integrase/recombinase XerD
MTASDLLDPSIKSLTIVNESAPVIDPQLEAKIRKAHKAWLVKSPSADTRSNYQRDLTQFLAYFGYGADDMGKLAAVEPHHIAAWRDHLAAEKLATSSIRRKLTVLRSLFSYLQMHGLVPTNPAHPNFVSAPAAPEDGKTVGLTRADCARLLDAPITTMTKEESDGTRIEIPMPMGIRDRALLAVLAYTACRVGEVTRLKVGDYRQTDGHNVLHVVGKGGKERRVPLNPRAAQRLEAWLTIAGIRQDLSGPIFRPLKSSRKKAKDEFANRPLTRRAIQVIVKDHGRQLNLDPHFTVHSLRVTALTTARQLGSDIIKY